MRTKVVSKLNHPRLGAEIHQTDFQKCSTPCFWVRGGVDDQILPRISFDFGALIPGSGGQAVLQSALARNPLNAISSGFFFLRDGTLLLVTEPGRACNERGSALELEGWRNGGNAINLIGLHFFTSSECCSAME